MKEKSVFIIFPHHLFKQTHLLDKVHEVLLIEEHLFFRQYKFHKQKIMLHRGSMRYYADYLSSKKLKVTYIEAIDPLSHIQSCIEYLSKRGIKQVSIYDVTDDWLSTRINKACKKHSINLIIHESLLFMNSNADIKEYFKSQSKFLHSDFYIKQRKKYSILLDKDKKPEGGKWSFDTDNRLKYPKNKLPPKVEYPEKNKYAEEAKQYVLKHFTDHYGQLSDHCLYPMTHADSERWLKQFLEYRFMEFGEYEDAIVKNEHILHHSVLSPLLNIGLLTPHEVIQEALIAAEKYKVALNSLEGFIRQIIGWREYIRGLYCMLGRRQRSKNFWKFTRPIPSCFYTATTGIEPIDQTIRKILQTGYCHHIERLMLIGNFMLLCEFHPHDVYRWFMELFIDAYDWVMVPNLYGMSQFADGGLMSTKPYISGSSYVLKMSDYKKGNWCQVWDALFWRFMIKQKDFFNSNPRMSMLLKVWDKMDENKKEANLKCATEFLSNLSKI